MEQKKNNILFQHLFQQFETIIKKKSNKYNVVKDTYYHSYLINKLINKIMYQGKKEIATKLVYKTLFEIKKETNQNPLIILFIAINNIRPYIEVRSRRFGRSIYKIPFPIGSYRQLAFALRWLVESARKNVSINKSFSISLKEEIINAFNNKGNTIEKKNKLHKLAEENQVFSHFRW